MPIYLGVEIPGPWFVTHRDNPQLKAFVRGATAAAAGATGGATVILTRQAIMDFPTALIALAALFLIWRLKVQEPFVAGLAGIFGVLLY